MMNVDELENICEMKRGKKNKKIGGITCGFQIGLGRER